MDTTAINKARIVYYGLFSSLFSFTLDEKAFEKISQSVDILSQNSIDEQSEKAFVNMKRRMKKGGYAALQKEHNRIFYSPSYSPVPMTGSYYADGRDNGPQRVEMINYVLESSFRRNADSYQEYEDHVEFVMIFLQKLIDNENEGDTTARELVEKVFGKIMNPMIDEFTTRVFEHEQSYFYKQVALALRSFIEFERVYLNIPAPLKTDMSAARRAGTADTRKTSGGCININADILTQ